MEITWRKFQFGPAKFKSNQKSKYSGTFHSSVVQYETEIKNSLEGGPDREKFDIISSLSFFNVVIAKLGVQILKF